MDAERVSRGAKRLAAIVGMGALWPSVFNQLLYPVTFTYNKTGDPATYSFHIIYSVLLIGVAVVLGIAHKRTDRLLLTNGKLVSLFGIMGAAGIILVSQFDFSSTASTTLIGVGVGFVALYVPVHFLFWAMQFAEDQQRSAMVDMSLSLALFGAVTGARLALGIHALEITAACPLVSTALAVYATRGETPRSSCTGTFGMRALPLNFIVPCLVFIALCTVGILLFNDGAKLQTQPPNRALAYGITVLAFGVLAVLFRSNAKNKRGASLKAFAFVSMLFVGAVLCACLISGDVLSAGSVPLIAANIALTGFVWMIILRDASRMHASPTFLMALFLAVVICIPRFVRACVMYQGSYLSVFTDSLNLFLITTASAFASVIIVIVTLMRFFVKTELAPETDEKQEAGDPVFDDMRKAFDLSDREVEIAQLAVQNLSAKKVAEQLFIAESTVYTHFKRIYRKTGVHSKQELIDLVEEYRR